MSKSFHKFLDVSFLTGYRFNNKILKNLKKSLTKVEFTNEKTSSVYNLACKIIDRKKKPKDEKILDFLKKISDPNILKIHSIFQNGQFLYIFSEWINDGDLNDLITQKGAVDEKQSKIWMQQIISGLQYLHHQLVAHCNLSCKAILLCNENIKISCLSYLQICKMNEKIQMKAKNSIPNFYRAPEVNLMKLFDPFKADVFCLGVILFMMLNAMIPFPSQDFNQLIDDQKHRRYYIRKSNIHKLSVDCQVAIHTLLEPDECIRWNINKINTMKWFSL